MESAEFRTMSHDVSSGMLNKLGISVFELFLAWSQLSFVQCLMLSVLVY